MDIRNTRDWAAAVRAERRRLGLSQAVVAERAGVGRNRIIALEKGKATVEVGLVLRTLRALGLAVRLGQPAAVPEPGIDLDELLGDAPRGA